MNQNLSMMAGCACLLLSSCTSIEKPADPVSATLVMEASQAAYSASAADGEGTLNYQGKEHPFTISALGGGGSGAMAISATGRVYNLASLQEFPGRYTSHRKGITVGKGDFTALLESDRGVKIYLEGETTGMGSSMGMSSVEIELK